MQYRKVSRLVGPLIHCIFVEKMEIHITANSVISHNVKGFSQVR